MSKESINSDFLDELLRLGRRMVDSVESEWPASCDEYQEAQQWVEVANLIEGDRRNVSEDSVRWTPQIHNNPSTLREAVEDAAARIDILTGLQNIGLAHEIAKKYNTSPVFIAEKVVQVARPETQYQY